jgi:hypothetical protein
MVEPGANNRSAKQVTLPLAEQTTFIQRQK